MRKEIKLIQLLVLSTLILVFAGSRLFLRNNTQVTAAPDKEESVLVSRVVDGDTLKLIDGRRVRLIGVDTPELHYSEKLLRDAKRSKKDVRVIQELGEKASGYTKKLCEKKPVKLKTDVCKKDRYGRILAYAYLEDGTFVNAKIIEEGYGKVMTIPPNVKYAEYFLKLQREARNGRRGLWELTDDL